MSTATSRAPTNIKKEKEAARRIAGALSGGNGLTRNDINTIVNGYFANRPHASIINGRDAMNFSVAVHKYYTEVLPLLRLRR